MALIQRKAFPLAVAGMVAAWLVVGQDAGKPGAAQEPGGPPAVAAASAKPAPVQPVPYSHKSHVALGLKCAECHTGPDPGEMMTFPAASKCMACHVAIAKDKPSIQKLTQLAKLKSGVPWVRVYQIPAYVFFSHREHTRAGAKCETCHGPVGERDVLAQEKETSMGACMDCHRQHKASLDCAFCHETRQ